MVDRVDRSDSAPIGRLKGDGARSDDRPGHRRIRRWCRINRAFPATWLPATCHKCTPPGRYNLNDVSNAGSNKKVANSLVALSSAAVLSVYGAGYARTRAAADRIAVQAAERRSHARPPRHEAERPGTAAAVQSVAPAPAPAVANATVPEPPVPSSSSSPSRQDDKGTSPAQTAATRRPATAVTEHEVPVQRRNEEPETAPSTTAATDAPSAITEETTATPAVATAPAASEKARYRDGTYFGWGTSRHGDIQAAVSVEEGRIVSATVAQCLTRYSCAWIAPLPPRIVRDQGTTFDYVSGATESSDAFQDAVADALTHAQ